MNGKFTLPLEQIVVERGIGILRKHRQITPGVVVLVGIFLAQLFSQPPIAFVFLATLFIFFPLVRFTRQPFFQLFRGQVTLIPGKDMFKRPDADLTVADEVIAHRPATPAKSNIVKQQITVKRNISPLLIIVAIFVGRVSLCLSQLFPPGISLKFPRFYSVFPVDVPAESMIQKRIPEPCRQTVISCTDLLPDGKSGRLIDFLLNYRQKRKKFV